MNTVISMEILQPLCKYCYRYCEYCNLDVTTTTISMGEIQTERERVRVTWQECLIEKVNICQMAKIC